MTLLAGIFIGGSGRRMGGVPKGLLRVDGETIVARTRHVLDLSGIEAILVGKHDAYRDESLTTIEDDPRAEGPLAGLIALLTHARGRTTLAIACDMPFVTEASIRKLIATASTAAILAPKRDGRWEPFFARYEPARVLPRAIARALAGEHRLQTLLDEVQAEVLPLDDETTLVDWDSPADLPPGFTDALLRGKRGS